MHRCLTQYTLSDTTVKKFSHSSYSITNKATPVNFLTLDIKQAEATSSARTAAGPAPT